MSIISYSPLTGKPLQEFEETTYSELNSLIDSAKVAQKKWQSLSKEERITTIKKLSAVLETHKDEILQTIHDECGFDKEEIEGAYFDVLDGIEYYSDVYSKKEDIDFPIDQNVFPESTSQIQYYPLGIIGHIGIWNYPFWQTMISAIPALLCGNAVIFKPSEYATITGVLIGKMLNEVLPKNIFTVVIGGQSLGEDIVSSSVDAIVYTGNIETGLHIRAHAGIKPTILELSGNDAAIIRSDCDIQQTVTGLVSGAFLHSGEVCDRIKRVYVHKDIAQEFIAQVTKRTESVQDQITPLISQPALDKVHQQVLDTVRGGAKILTGGAIKEKAGWYYAPTILLLESNTVESVTNEIFGPVLSIMVVESDEQALEYANATAYGLGTSIWTQNYEVASDLAKQCESGMVWINDSNIPLVCGEYFKGWKYTSVANASDRLSLFLKTKTIITFESKNSRDWWFAK